MRAPGGSEHQDHRGQRATGQARLRPELDPEPRVVDRTPGPGGLDPDPQLRVLAVAQLTPDATRTPLLLMREAHMNAADGALLYPYHLLLHALPLDLPVVVDPRQALEPDAAGLVQTPDPGVDRLVDPLPRRRFDDRGRIHVQVEVGDGHPVDLVGFEVAQGAVVGHLAGYLATAGEVGVAGHGAEVRNVVDRDRAAEEPLVLAIAVGAARDGRDRGALIDGDNLGKGLAGGVLEVHLPRAAGQGLVGAVPGADQSAAGGVEGLGARAGGGRVPGGEGAAVAGAGRRRDVECGRRVDRIEDQLHVAGIAGGVGLPADRGQGIACQILGGEATAAAAATAPAAAAPGIGGENIDAGGAVAAAAGGGQLGVGGVGPAGRAVVAGA